MTEIESEQNNNQNISQNYINLLNNLILSLKSNPINSLNNLSNIEFLYSLIIEKLKLNYDNLNSKLKNDIFKFNQNYEKKNRKFSKISKRRKK